MISLYCFMTPLLSALRRRCGEREDVDSHEVWLGVGIRDIEVRGRGRGWGWISYAYEYFKTLLHDGDRDRHAT